MLTTCAPVFGVFDPYPPLREKIDTARDTFSKLKQHCCCLVLYTVDTPLILLDWQHVCGAMLSNLGWSVPLDLPGRPAPEGEICSRHRAPDSATCAGPILPVSTKRS